MASTHPKQPSAPGAGRSRTPLILAVGFVVLVLAGVIAIAATRDDDGGTAASDVPQNRTVEVTGAPLPELAEASGAADPAVGQPAPEIRGAAFDGTRTSILRDGKPKVVIFVAHWCPHCQAEIPVVEQFLADNPDTGVDVFAVSTSVNKDAPNYPPSKWLGDEWSHPVIVDDQQSTAAASWGLPAFPYFVSLDAEGKVLVRRTGELSPADLQVLFEQAAATAG